MRDRLHKPGQWPRRAVLLGAAGAALVGLLLASPAPASEEHSPVSYSQPEFVDLTSHDYKELFSLANSGTPVLINGFSGDMSQRLVIMAFYNHRQMRALVQDMWQLDRRRQRRLRLKEERVTTRREILQLQTARDRALSEGAEQVAKTFEFHRQGAMEHLRTIELWTTNVSEGQ